MRQFDFFNPNSTIPLGYTFSYFPFNFYGKYDNVLKGIYQEPWNIISEKTGVSFTSQYGSNFDNLNDIANGTILTMIDGTAQINESLKHDYSYSVPFYLSSYGIYEARRPLHHTTSFGMFAVFNFFTWTILIALAFVAKLIEKLRRHLRGGHNELTRIPTMVYLVAILSIVCIHTAGFKGNAVITAFTPTSYTQLVTGLRTGNRQLVLQRTLTNPLADGVDYMLGNKSKPVLTMEPTWYRLEQVCINQEYVTRIFTLDLVVLQLIDLPCTLDRIFIDHSLMGQSAPHSEQFDIDLPYMFVFKRGAVTKKSVEMLNQILLRMFRDEQISQLWMQRFLRTYATKSENQQRKALEYKPISGDTYLHLVPLFVSLYLLCFILLAYELASAHRNPCSVLLNRIRK